MDLSDPSSLFLLWSSEGLDYSIRITFLQLFSLLSGMNTDLKWSYNENVTDPRRFV